MTMIKEMTVLRKLFKRLHDETGIGLAETLVAVAVLGTSIVAFVVSLSTGSLSVNEQDKETVAQSLAQTQVEYTKNYLYNPAASTYPTVAAPSGYTISVGVSSISGTDSNIQKITVNILRDGSSVFLVSDYKVNR